MNGDAVLAIGLFLFLQVGLYFAFDPFGRIADRRHREWCRDLRCRRCFPWLRDRRHDQ